MPVVTPHEWELVLSWRLGRLVELGLSEHDAEELALSRADIGDVKKLIEEGCPHELLAAILA